MKMAGTALTFPECSAFVISSFHVRRVETIGPITMPSVQFSVAIPMIYWMESQTKIRSAKIPGY